jgi:hypothetical protein
MSTPRNINEYRITRPSKYPVGTSPMSMEGHYFRAKSQEEALDSAEEKFPRERLQVRLWKAWDDTGRCIRH